MNASTRQLKVARLLQKELSEVLKPEMQLRFPGAMITITKVNISPDLGVAHVYLSVFMAKAEQVIAQITLDHTEIRYKLGQRIRHQLRIVPELHFHIDDSLDYIDRIDQLLKQ
jgi:ribosome-binding factor A